MSPDYDHALRSVSASRRTLLRGTGAVVTATVTGAVPAFEAFAQGGATPAGGATPVTIVPGASWPTLQGDPARTGAAADAAFTGEPTLLWRFETGLSGSNASPVIVDGVVYSTAGVLDAGVVFALDLRTGDLLWSVEVDAVPFGSTPAVADGIIYIAGLNGTVYAIDLDTQETLWTASLGSSTSSSPVVVGDIIACGADDDHLHVLDRADGTERWALRVGEGTSYVLGPSPSYANDVLYYASLNADRDGALHAANAGTGEELWRFAPDNPGLGTPAIADDVAYVGSDAGGVYAIDTRSGDELWSAEVGRVVSAPAIIDDAVIVQSMQGVLLSLDRATGEVTWQASNRASWSSPVIANDLAIVGVDDLWFAMGIHGFDLETGEKRWHVRTNGTVSPPAVSGNVLVVADSGGVTAIGSADGDALSRGTNGEGTYFGEVRFSEAVDDANLPIDPAPVLPHGTAELFAAWDHVGVSGEATSDVTWWLDGEVVVERSAPWGGPSAGHAWERIVSSEGPLPVGTYEIELGLDGVPMRRATVQIS